MKCFFSSKEIFSHITSNFLTGMLKIIVITTNIYLLIFHLWFGKTVLGANYFHSCVEFEGRAGWESCQAGRETSRAGTSSLHESNIVEIGRPHSKIKIADLNPDDVCFLLPRLK